MVRIQGCTCEFVFRESINSLKIDFLCCVAPYSGSDFGWKLNVVALLSIRFGIFTNSPPTLRQILLIGYDGRFYSLSVAVSAV